MFITDLRVVVEQPTDWVSAVAIPVAAILVSSLIAIGIASAERRAADRAHVRQAAVGLIRELGGMVRVSKVSTAAMNAQLDVLMMEINALSALLPGRKVAVPQYVSLVLAQVIRTNEPEQISSTAAWLTAAVDNWLRGDLSARAFRRAMPPDTWNEWTMTVDLTDWSKVVSGKIKV